MFRLLPRCPDLIFPISYDSLKKYIYQLEKQQAGREQIRVSDLESNERSSLLHQTDVTNTDILFIPLLDRELHKIISFYEHQEKELLEELDTLEKDVALQDELGLHGEELWENYADEDDEEDDESISRSPEGRRRSLSFRRKRSSSGRPQSWSSPLSFFTFLCLSSRAQHVLRAPQTKHRILGRRCSRYIRKFNDTPEINFYVRHPWQDHNKVDESQR